MGKKTCCIADAVLSALHVHAEESVFNGRRAAVFASFPEDADFDREVVQFFLERLEQCMGEGKTVSSLFRFAVLCEFQTFSSGGWDSRRQLLFSREGGGCTEAAAALVGLIAHLCDTDVLQTLEGFQPPTDATRRKYAQDCRQALDTLEALIYSAGYLDSGTKKNLWEWGRDWFWASLRDNEILPPTHSRRLLPARAAECELSAAQDPKSAWGTRVSFTLGILI